MATIDKNFRADISRSICVFGEFTNELVSQLAPQVLNLRAPGDAPITVFINSNGGAIQCLDYLRGLLLTKGPSGKRPRVITVAVGNARSAAATLLALGDYAIAYPNSSIHFHGVRYSEVEDVTMESASSMAAQLESKNRATAALLAQAGTERLAFHYARFKSKFSEIRKSLGKSGHTDIECFALALKNELSLNGDRIVDRAIERWHWLQELSEKTIAKVKGLGKKGVDFEAAVLRKILIYEVSRNKGTDWCLNRRGVFQIAADYLLLRDYDLGRHVRLMNTLVERFGFAFFEEAELKQMLAAQEQGNATDPANQALVTGRIQQTIKPFCYFASSIWEGLQEDENALSPRDAYWLGAVDEVYDSNLPCLREIAESQDPAQSNLQI